MGKNFKLTHILLVFYIFNHTKACFLSADKTSLKCFESVDLGSISPTRSNFEFRSAGEKSPNAKKSKTSDKILKPEMLRTLPDLSSFWAEQTGLRSLPKELFRSNNKLDHLVFSQNRIRQLPEKLLPKNASRLTEIRFDNNQLTSVPNDLLSTAENLVTVHLENNFLRALPDRFFSKSKKLREVYLQYNLLRSLGDTGFSLNRNLQKLWLYNNELGYDAINENTFSKNKNLEILSLANNHISWLHSETFSSLSKMSHLYLNDNRLFNVEIGLFNRTIALQFLYMGQRRR